MSRCRIIGCAVAILVGISAGTQAAVVLDQSMVNTTSPSTGSTSVGFGRDHECGQVVEAGIAGQLWAVEVLIHRQTMSEDPTPLVMNIYEWLDGAPGSSLASVEIPEEEIDQYWDFYWLEFDLSACGLTFDEGEKFVIALTSGGTSENPECYSWKTNHLPDNIDYYPAGMALYRRAGGTWHEPSPGNTMDCAFKTYVNSVPEPTAFAMWSVLGGIGMIAARRRRKAA